MKIPISFIFEEKKNLKIIGYMFSNFFDSLLTINVVYQHGPCPSINPLFCTIFE